MTTMDDSATRLPEDLTEGEEPSPFAAGVLGRGRRVPRISAEVPASDEMRAAGFSSSCSNGGSLLAQRPWRLLFPARFLRTLPLPIAVFFGPDMPFGMLLFWRPALESRMRSLASISTAHLSAYRSASSCL